MEISISAPMAQLPVRHHPVSKAEKAARDFEGILLGSLLDSLQKTFSGTTDEDGPPGSSSYGLMGIQALAAAIAARGGIGIAQLILRQWRETNVPSIG
jgi:Rod binding domain-containing protein